MATFATPSRSGLGSLTYVGKSVVKGRSRLEGKRSIHIGQGSIPIALDQHRHRGAEEIDARFVRIQLNNAVDIGQGKSIVTVFPENK